MKQILIKPDDLIKYMGEENYYNFLDNLIKQNNVPENVPIWIIGEYDND